MKQALVWLCLWGFICLAAPRAYAVEECPPVELRTVQDMLTEAQSRLQLVDYTAALSTLEDAERLLPCVAEFVLPQVLSRLFLFRGLTWYYLSNNDEARLAFLRALAVDADLQWDPKFGMRPKKTFDEAVAQLKTRPRQPVRIPPLVKEVTLFFDGNEVSPGTAATLAPGSHFLQLKWEEGRWEGAFFDVTAGREVTLPLPPRALKAAGSDRTPVRQPTGGEDPGHSTVNTTHTRPADDRPSRTPFLVSASVAGVGLASGITVTILHQITRSQLCGGGFQPFGCEVQPIDNEENRELSRKSQITGPIANASWALTAVATGSAIFFYQRLKADEKRRERNTLLLPVLTPDSAAVLFHHEF